MKLLVLSTPHGATLWVNPAHVIAIDSSGPGGTEPARVFLASGQVIDLDAYGVEPAMFARWVNTELGS